MKNIESIDNAIEKVEKNSTETPIIPVETTQHRNERPDRRTHHWPAGT